MQQLRAENAELRRRVDALGQQLQEKQQRILSLEAQLRNRGETLAPADSCNLSIRETIDFFGKEVENLKYVDFQKSASQNNLSRSQRILSRSQTLNGSRHPSSNIQLPDPDAGSEPPSSSMLEHAQNVPVQLGCSKSTLQQLGTLVQKTLLNMRPEEPAKGRRPPVAYRCRYNNIKQVIEYLRYGTLKHEDLPDLSAFENEPGHFALVLNAKMQVDGLVLYEGGADFTTVFLREGREVRISSIIKCYRIVKTGRVRLQECGSSFGDGVDAVRT